MAADNLIERLPRRLKMGELRVFVAILEHRSFRKAAAALHITQPAVTKAIAGMEDLLEVRLFDRKAGGVEPTVHGLSFAPHAIAIFNESNPQRDVANFFLGPRAGRAAISTRIRLATSQQLVAVAKMSDGSCWSHTVDVLVTLAACVEP